MKSLIYITLAVLFTLSAEAGVDTTGNKFGDEIPRLKAEFYSLQKDYKGKMDKTCNEDEAYESHLRYSRKYMNLMYAYYLFEEKKRSSVVQMSNGLAVADALEVANNARTEAYCEIEDSYLNTMEEIFAKCYPEIVLSPRTPRGCDPMNNFLRRHRG